MNKAFIAAAFAALSVSAAWAQTPTATPAPTVTNGTMMFKEIKDERLVVQPFNLTVDKMDDMNVVNAAGEKIGEIDEVLMDGSGKPVAVTVEVGGFLGIGGREVIVTFEQLQLQGDRFLVNMTKQQLETLPKWDS